MQAVIMAGGLGTRLKDITHDNMPKPMVTIMGKPLLQWQIENLKESGIDDIILVVGPHYNIIYDWFGTSVSYYTETTPLGTAGALPWMKELLNDEFFLIYGDVFFDIDFQRMIDFHHAHKGEGTLFIHPNSHPYDSDLVELDKNSKIQQIFTKEILIQLNGNIIILTLVFIYLINLF